MTFSEDSTLKWRIILSEREKEEKTGVNYEMNKSGPGIVAHTSNW